MKLILASMGSVQAYSQKMNGLRFVTDQSASKVLLYVVLSCTFKDKHVFCVYLLLFLYSFFPTEMAFMSEWLMLIMNLLNLQMQRPTQHIRLASFTKASAHNCAS